MKVYLVRHGDYVASCSDHPLSEKGVDEMCRAAFFLKEQGITDAEIWCSPKTRAVQSAQIISKILGIKIVKEKEELKPDAVPQQILNAIEGCCQDRIFVSHLPLIPRILTRIFPDQVFAAASFPTASVVVLDRTESGWVSLGVF